MASKEHIERLQGVIRQSYGVDAKHLKSTNVWEGFRPETGWDGVVEVFELRDQGEEKRCYAWIENDHKIEVVLALSSGIGIDAVKVIIMTMYGVSYVHSFS